MNMGGGGLIEGGLLERGLNKFLHLKGDLVRYGGAYLRGEGANREFIIYQ